jgi:tripeptide aminopeptidase
MATDTPTALAAELAEDAAERLLRYVRIDTQSDADSDTYPSTAKQLDLLRLLLAELKELGLDDASIDDHGYVTATLPATTDRDVPTIAFFAHVDTARECSGANVRPQRIRYEGGDVTLGKSGQVILRSRHSCSTTSGTTSSPPTAPRSSAPTTRRASPRSWRRPRIWSRTRRCRTAR